MKTSSLLLVTAILAANALAIDPLPPPSLALKSQKYHYFFDLAVDGRRKFVMVGETPKTVRVRGLYMDVKGEWMADSTVADCGDAMDPHLYGVARSNSRFVAVGGHNYRSKDPSREYPVISVSDDGVAWQASLGPAKGVLWGVATDGGDRWVAVGSQQILFSEDGAKTWTVSNDQTGGETRAVHRGGADWMAATLVPGTGTRFHVSALGKMWTQVATVPGVEINSLTENQGTWIAVGRYTGDQSRTCILRSTNQGQKWTDVGPSLASTVLRDVTFGEKTGFVAVGREGWRSLVLWSQDGSSWEKIYEPFGGELYAVQLWDSFEEIVMMGDTGKVWLDTLAFDKRGNQSDTRIASRPISAWKQIGSRLEVPQWVSGNIQATISNLEGRMESSKFMYLGSSSSIDLPRSWGPRILRVRDEAGNVHVQKLSPTIPLF
ncbi:MAG: hypothetical protein IPN71_23260 [Fibrobacteres bacterium]|nr:hypothetical protein [Fibrobacterota bacterium]